MVDVSFTKRNQLTLISYSSFYTPQPMSCNFFKWR